MALAALQASCGTTSPAAPTTVTIEPPPGPALHDVTLVVVEDTPGGLRPVPFPGGVFNYHRPGENYGTGDSFVGDADGRKVFPHVLHGTDVRILGIRSGYTQPCFVGGQVVAESTMQLELVKRGSRPRVLESPTLSVTVYNNTPHGRAPVPDLQIQFAGGARGLTAGYGWTDSDGRYEFCRLPRGPGKIVMYWGFDSEFSKEVGLNITGDQVVDIEIVK
jgi:hypothetical protein